MNLISHISFWILMSQVKCEFQEIFETDINEEAVITTFTSKTYTYCYIKCQKMSECAKVAFTEKKGMVTCFMMKEMTSQEKSKPANTKKSMKNVNTVRPQSSLKKKQKKAVNECLVNNGGCDHLCVDTSVSFYCQCKTGYTLHCEGKLCLDIDECSRKHNCHANALCVNTAGSYNCSCNAGWRGDGRTCQDIDECGENTHNCHINAVCTNTNGSFNCACNSGWKGNGIECADVDECSGKHDCDVNALCVNTAGSYNCSCNAGWRGDGRTCQDIDECGENTHNCHINAACTNTIGSFNCACNSGWKGNGTECADIDECVEKGEKKHNCDINAACHNNDGSFTCSCKEGWPGRGTTCQDVDECMEGKHTCSTRSACVNLGGSFECSYDCNYNGYELGGSIHFPNPVYGEDGTRYVQGHVEILHNGEWGTICDDSFNHGLPQDCTASYLCRMGGYKTGAFDNGVYKQSGATKSGKIWLDELRCGTNGCSHREWGQHNCNHGEDVGIRCYS